MGLIKCQECGKEISDKADKCVGCGAPISVSIQEPLPTSEVKRDVGKRSRGMSPAIPAAACFILVAIGFISFIAPRCTPAEKETVSYSAPPVQTQQPAMATPFGLREVVGSGAWYTWDGDWYSLSFAAQREVMQKIANLERKESGGKISHVHIEYNGTRVAEFTPNGGVVVLKSRP